MTMMSYKAYEAAVEYDEDAEIFHGEVINLRDVITFQGKSVSELKRAFAASVEDYLAFCRQRGEEPDQTGLVPHRVTGHSMPNRGDRRDADNAGRPVPAQRGEMP